MVSSRFFSGVVILALVAGAAFSRSSAAGELIDNEKLLEMIGGGTNPDGALSPKVIMATIAASPKDCHFSSTVKDKITIQAACRAAKTDPKWTKEEIDALQVEVGRLATQTTTDFKNLVNLFLTSAENDDKVNNPQLYEELMHKLIRAGSAVVPYLRDNLTQESERKKAAVLEALGRIGDKTPELVKEIEMLLDDPSKPVRAQAAKTVQILSNATTGERLITMLSRRDNKNDGVALALGYMRYEPAIGPLVQVLKSSRESDDRICAAFALGEMRAKTLGAPEQLLFGVLDDRDEKLRAVCANALGLIGDKRTPSYITKAFDRFHTGRLAVIDALRFFRTIYVVKFLAENLDIAEAGPDENEIRKLSLKMLETMTGEKYETKEQWLAFIELLSLRPEWQEPKEAEKLPEPQDPGK